MQIVNDKIAVFGSAEEGALKQIEVCAQTAHDSRMVDPLAQKGGSKEYIKAEMQSIAALEDNVVNTRLAIQKANADNVININGIEKSVAAWLIWRREVAPLLQSFFRNVDSKLTQSRAQIAQANRSLAAGATASDLVVYVDEKKIAEDAETIGEVLGVLDGRLSAFNATHTIDVA